MVALSAAAGLSLASGAPDDLMTAEQRAWLVHAGQDASSDAAGFPPMSGRQAAQLFAAEESFYQTYYSYHQAWGQYANPHYTSRTDRSVVLSWDELGDSACWSGHMLAALAHRYNVTRESGTLERINDSLGAFENLTQASGKPGFMVRFLGRADDKAYQNYYCHSNCSAKHGDNWFHGAADYEQWVFLDSLSRDAYFGAALGLVSVLQKVDDASTHERVAAILCARSLSHRAPTPLTCMELIHWLPICRRLMANTLCEDKWWIISPHVGQTSRVVPVNPVPSFIALWQVCKPDSIILPCLSSL